MPTSADGKSPLEAFLDLYWEDREAGGVRPIEEYLTLFPGEGDAIAAEFTDLQRQDDSWAAADGDALGPYLLEEEIGRGGQGIVYRATDQRIDRTVALKVLRNVGPGAVEMLIRFKREAKAASSAEHAGICPVYDVGVESGVPFIAMRHIEGDTLATKIARTREEQSADRSMNLTWPGGVGVDEHANPTVEAPGITATRDSGIMLVVQLVEKTARALHAVHEAGVIHRDVKPRNIMITADGDPVLMDFGLARIDELTGDDLTQAGDFFGTPAYMSPEQLTRQNIRLDRRTDVWSLGVVLYECLTLKRPFDSPTREGLYQDILAREPSDPRRTTPAIPRDLAVLVATAMEKDRNRRYQTASDMADDLERIRLIKPVRAKPVSAWGRVVRWARRRPAHAGLLALAVVGFPLVAGMGGYIIAVQSDVEAQRQADQDRLVQRHVDKGLFELFHGDPRVAAQEFGSALAADAGCAEAVCGLALALIKLKKPESALRSLKQAESSLATPALLASVKADALVALDRLSDAQQLRSAVPKRGGPLLLFLESVREMERAHYFGEMTPKGLSRLRRCRRLIDRAVMTSPSARRAYHYMLAHSIAHLDDDDDRNSISESLTTIWPNESYAWYWSAFAQMAVNAARAEREYRKAIQLEPNHAGLRTQFGYFLVDQGRLDDAIVAFNESLSIKPDYYLAMNGLGSALDKKGDHQAAVRVIRESIRIAPNYYLTWDKLGQALQNDGDLDEAISAHQTAVKIRPEYHVAWCNLGKALDDSGRPEDAIKALKKGIELMPEYAMGWNNLGAALYKLGKLDESIHACRESLNINSDQFRAWNNLGNALLAQGKPVEAEESVRNALEVNELYTAGWNNLGNALRAQGKPDRAIEAYQEALNISPGFGVAWSNIGTVLKSKGQLDDALVAFREAVKLQPSLYQAWYNFGSTLQQLGLVDEGVTACRKAIEIKPDHYQAWSDLGIGLRIQGHLKQSERACRRSLEIAPNYYLAMVNLGDTLCAAADPSQASACWIRAVRLDARHPAAWGRLSRLALRFERHKHIEEAVELQEQIVGLMKGEDVPNLKIDDARARLKRLRSVLDR